MSKALQNQDQIKVDVVGTHRLWRGLSTVTSPELDQARRTGSTGKCVLPTAAVLKAASACQSSARHEQVPGNPTYKVSPLSVMV